MLNRRRNLISLLVVAWMPLLQGCGASQPVDKDRTLVTGSVTFDGKPLPAGTITFTSTEKSIGTVLPIRKGGRYATDRAPLGPNIVTIDTSSIKFKNAADFVPIPAKYADASKSDLKIDVQPGENENVNFDLKK